MLPWMIVSGVRSSCDTSAIRFLRNVSASARLAAMPLKAVPRSPISSLLRTSTRCERSPAAMACAARVRRASGAVSRRLTNTPRPSDKAAASSAAHTNDLCTWRRKAWPWASSTTSTGRTFNNVPMTRPSRVIGTPWARTLAGSTSPTSSPVLLASTRPVGSATAKFGPAPAAPAPARPQPIPSPYRPGQAAPAALPRRPSFPAPRSNPSELCAQPIWPAIPLATTYWRNCSRVARADSTATTPIAAREIARKARLSLTQRRFTARLPACSPRRRRSGRSAGGAGRPPAWRAGS